MRTFSQNEIDIHKEYLELLSRSFPNILSAATEVINLKAIMNLPKGTEHFVTDIHGEDLAFNHVMQIASGVIKRKISEDFEGIDEETSREIATLIYYPEQKLNIIKKQKTKEELNAYYEEMMNRMLRVCRGASSKYTRSKIKKSLPDRFAYIIEELLQVDDHKCNRKEYYHEIVNSIIDLGQAEEFITAIASLIKRFTIDHLHVIGDIYDRGPGAEKCMDILMKHHSIDIQWGNHDVLWIGAAAGNKGCIANVLRIALRYANMDTIENGYGINLLPLATFAHKTYMDDSCTAFMPKVSKDSKVSEEDLPLLAKMHKAIAMIQFKVEHGIIDEHPEYHMQKRQLLTCVDYEHHILKMDGKTYRMNSCSFPTVDPENPAALTEEEETVLNKLVQYFIMSERLQKHIRYLFIKGSMYLTYNGNLLIHAGIPMHMNGTFREVAIEGVKYSGKALLDKYDKMVREAYFGTGNGYKVSTDLLWFLWCHKYSPCFGKDKMATFERYFLNDKETHKETYMPFYHIIDNEAITIEVLKEFGADPENGRLINGHVPVKELKGEKPMRAHGRRLVIDGGYAKPYQKSTGIAGYTLTYNSFGMVLISHKPFESVEKAVNKGLDIEGEKRVVDKAEKRMRVKDTDTGKKLSKQIYYLEMLISAYRKGSIIEGN